MALTKTTRRMLSSKSLAKKNRIPVKVNMTNKTFTVEQPEKVSNDKEKSTPEKIQQPVDEEEALSERKGYDTDSTSDESHSPSESTSLLGKSKKHDSQVFRLQEDNIMNDIMPLRKGSIPESVLVALVVGISCGVAAWMYYYMLEYFLELLWHELPKMTGFDQLPTYLHFLWIPFIALVMSVGVGLTVKYIGEPGDLAYTIKCVHKESYIEVDHVLPMLCASQFSILGGGSLGPEAPLVAICAAIGGYVSRALFKETNKNIVRKHTLMGMAAALAAFFGCPLGGSLFALEVNSRFGLEYFEHAIEAIFAGEICLCVFRTLAGLPIGNIWDMGVTLGSTSGRDVIVGMMIGATGAFVAYIFSLFHWKFNDYLKSRGLLDNNLAVQRALVGVVMIILMGLLVPQTMFWGENEFQQISTLSSADDLPHLWPPQGLTGFEMNSAFKCFVVGVAKLIAVSFTVNGGYRGGYIFPFFAAGAAFGRCITFIFPTIPSSIACLCFAAGINVAVTRTSLATTTILCFLAAEQNATSSVLAAALVSLVVTVYMPFIRTQVPRADLSNSLFFLSEEEIDNNTHGHGKESDVSVPVSIPNPAEEIV